MSTVFVEGIWPYRPTEFKPALLCSTVRSEYALEVERDRPAQVTLYTVAEVLRAAFRRLIGALPDAERRIHVGDFDTAVRRSAYTYRRRKTIKKPARKTAGSILASRDQLFSHLGSFASAAGQFREAPQGAGMEELEKLLRTMCQQARMIRCHLVGLLAYEEEHQLQSLFGRVVEELRPVAEFYRAEPKISGGLSKEGRYYLRNIRMRYHFLRLLRDILYRPRDESKLLTLALLDMAHRRSVQTAEISSAATRIQRGVFGLTRECDLVLSVLAER
jgi:hypothetical protein